MPLQSNIRVLEEILSKREMHELLVDFPALPCQPLRAWLDFLATFGAPRDTCRRLLLHSPRLFFGSIYQTGRTIMFFKTHGWRNEDVLQRLMQYYPQLLSLNVETDICPVISYLESHGCSADDIRLLVWEYPRIFSKDFRRQVRKFQHLGVYGLKLPVSSSS